MRIKKGAILGLAIVFTVAIICGAAGFSEELLSVWTKPTQEKTIIIDAGHAALENTID